MNGQTFDGVLHDLRKTVDGAIKAVGSWRIERGLDQPVGKEQAECQREIALAYTKLQEAKMWLGKALEVVGSQLPAEYRDEAVSSDK